MIDILLSIFLGALLFFSTLTFIVLVLGLVALILAVVKEIFKDVFD